MTKVAIVGVEGSGKTVLLACLGELYSRPDEQGYYLSPKDFRTATYVSEKIARLRGGEWPSATAEDVMQGLDWTLRRKSDVDRRPADICEISCLDFAGEVYRRAFVESDGAKNDTLQAEGEKLLDYVARADVLLVLVNLSDVITRGPLDRRVQESMWVTNAILNEALKERSGRAIPRAAIVLSQADRYKDTIRACDGAKKTLERYLPLLANDYGWLSVFEACSVDKTTLDDEGQIVPAPDFKTTELKPIVNWILQDSLEEFSDKSSGRNEQPKDEENTSVEMLGGVQLWEGGPYWAECNVGATKPEERGYYFWWGDTVGYQRNASCNGWESVKTGSSFTFVRENCPTYDKSGRELKSAGYIDSTGNLVAKYDAATAHLGVPWRMPTEAEFAALVSSCDTQWTTRNGVGGLLVTGRGAYASKSIFLPAAGYGSGSALDLAGTYGYFWSSTPYSDYFGDAWFLEFNSSHFYRESCSCYRGRSVRPVRGFAQ